MNVFVIRTPTETNVASEFPYSLNLHSTDSPKICLSHIQFQASAAV
jgi:hypothetical protein